MRNSLSHHLSRPLFSVAIVALAAAACAGTTVTATSPLPPAEAKAAATTAVLRAGLAATRALQIERLHDYRIAGEFPMDAMGPVSVFVDEAGRHCPMAALISQSGHDDLIDEVVKKNNQLQLASIHEGPLMSWILESGLTKDEVVMVQGAMTIELAGFEETDNSVMTAAAQHLVREKLRKIEDQLRANTAHSLDLAVASLPRGRRPAGTGPIVPKQLEAAAWVPRRARGFMAAQGTMMMPRMRY